MTYPYRPQSRSFKSEKTVYRLPAKVQYIVEYRPCLRGEEYLFTQKGVPFEGLSGPAVLRSQDPCPSLAVAGTVRPVVVGEIDPETDTVIYYKDQDR